MKRLILLAAMAFSLTGCDIVKNLVMDQIAEPEDILIDHISTLIEMNNNESDCDKLASKIAVYCERREEAITKASKDLLLKIENGKFDAKTRNEV